MARLDFDQNGFRPEPDGAATNGAFFRL